MTRAIPLCFTTLLILSLLGCQDDEASSTSSEEGAAERCDIRTTSDGPRLYCPGRDPQPVRQPGTPGTPGQDGQPGADGAKGEDGQDGLDGVDGLDGQPVWVERTHLEDDSELCPGGGQLIELHQGDVDETPDASFAVCDVVCSQGELYELFFDQCVKFTQIEFEGTLWRTVGDVDDDFFPSLLDPDPLSGSDGTPCSGTLTYPFMQSATSQDEFTALYEFGHYQNAGLTLTIGDEHYERDVSGPPRGSLEHPFLASDATMFRSAYPVFGDQTQLDVEVVQRGLRDVPSGVEATLRLTAGHDDLTFDEAQQLLSSPDRANQWLKLQDEIIESVALDVIDAVTEERARLVCRILHFH